MSNKFLLLTFIPGILMALGLGGYLYIKSQKHQLVSPIFNSVKLRIADTVWFPKKESSSSSTQDITKLTAKAAFFIDTDTGEVLFEKNAQEKLPIASLTKIMTAIVTMENSPLEQVVNISPLAASMEPDKMFLIAGEKMTVEELLQGIFLVSANDAAEALSEAVSGRREEFINLMNAKARQLGLVNTVFINPTGLMEDGKYQYSTAYEVAVMSRYAIKKFPHLLEISSKDHVFIPQEPSHQYYDLYSGINLLTTYPGVKGFKTGYTPEAGLTLVTVAERDGKQVLGVLLGSTERREDARLLLDYSFKKLGITPPKYIR